MRPAGLALLIALGAAAVAAPAASGHAFYVDAAAPPGASCQVGDPCKTIAEAMALPDPDPQSPDVIVVTPGAYTENVRLDVTPEVPYADRSLLAAGSGASIDPADPAQPTVEIGGAASVVGFAIGGQRPVVLNGPGRVSLSSFDSADLPVDGASVRIAAGAGDAVVDRNAFADDGAGTQAGVRSLSTGSPTIRQNAFTGLSTAIALGAGTPVLDSDLVIDGATGVSAANAAVSVLNLTAAGNSVTDLALQDADLTLSSSFVERPISGDSMSSCLSISHSAGPTLSGTPCETFQMANTAPGFADPSAGDYHLTESSPLIDAGDPLLLSGLDLDGNSRVADGNCDGTSVRDVGAYELSPACPPPPEPPPEPPPPPPAGDADPPQTEIVRKRVDGHSVTFRFRASEAGSSFLCQLDEGPYRGCESPVRYRGLDDGRHVFRVKAADVARNEDPVPAKKRFRIRRS